MPTVLRPGKVALKPKTSKWLFNHAAHVEGVLVKVFKAGGYQVNAQLDDRSTYCEGFIDRLKLLTLLANGSLKGKPLTFIVGHDGSTIGTLCSDNAVEATLTRVEQRAAFDFSAEVGKAADVAFARLCRNVYEPLYLYYRRHGIAVGEIGEPMPGDLPLDGSVTPEGRGPGGWERHHERIPGDLERPQLYVWIRQRADRFPLY